MRRTLSESDMLAIWRRARAIEPLRLDCTASRTDGPDIDALLIDEMRAWYLNLLDHAPLSRIAVCNTAASASVLTSSLLTGLTLVTAPDGCRRIFSVFFDGWDLPVDVTDSPPPRSVGNPFCTRPRAYRLGPDRVAVVGARGELKELNCAVDVSDKVYIIDDSALKEIPRFI